VITSRGRLRDVRLHGAASLASDAGFRDAASRIPAKSVAPRLLLLLALAQPTLSCAASDAEHCLAEFKAEQDRIEREYAVRRPAGDAAMELQWSRSLDATLEAAARRAERCRQDGRLKVGGEPFKRALDRADLCSANAMRQIAELDRRYQGRSLNVAEQTARWDEEARIIDARVRCLHETGR
jgi:cell pole-organizing protein PopZ